jgi:hypothetical protein
MTDPLEQALSSLNPSHVPGSLEQRIARTIRWQKQRRAWIVVSLGGAVAIALAYFANQQMRTRLENTLPTPEVIAQQPETPAWSPDAPNLCNYTQALIHSADALDQLLSQHGQRHHLQSGLSASTRTLSTNR